MNNNEKFDNILNECLERMLKGESVEQCLQRYPGEAKELEPLLRTACETRQVCAFKPRAEFKEKARFQFRTLMAEKFSQPEPRRARHWFYIWRSAWATAVTAVLVVALLTSGTVAAASNSMPDQPLYPVKLVTEELRVKMTTSRLAKAELIAELADKRVTEIIYLADKNAPDKLEKTTQRLNSNLATIASLAQSKNKPVAMMAAPRQADAGAEQAPSFGAAKSAPAPALAPAPSPAPARPAPGQTVPPKARPTTTPAPTAVPAPTPTPKPVPPPTTAAPRPTLAPRTSSAPKAIAPAPGTQVKEKAADAAKPVTAEAAERAKLKQMIVRYAVNHPAKLAEALKKAPPSARPALRKAIEESLAAYQQAIQNIEAEEDE